MIHLEVPEIRKPNERCTGGISKGSFIVEGISTTKIAFEKPSRLAEKHFEVLGLAKEHFEVPGSLEEYFEEPPGPTKEC